MKQIFIILFCLIHSILLIAQKSNIIGKIVTLNQSNPIQGAVIKYGKYGSISDKNGFFTIHLIDYSKKSTIFISAIGYKTMIVDDFDFNTLLKINLEDSISSLPNVTISSGTNALIKKAIENIPLNYIQKSFTQTGILRLFYDIDNGYHYQNDAIIENFIPPYNSHNEISVHLKGNVASLYYDIDSSSILIRNWVKAYTIVANQDFVHRRHDFINLKKISSYNYKLINTYSMGSNRLFLIDFSSKDGIRGVNYKKIKGQLLIDSASLAFVKVDLVIDEIKDPIYVEIDKLYLTVEYKKNENLWYIDRIQSETISKKTNNLISHSRVFYLATDNDISRQKDFAYLEKIQNSDITQKLNITLNKKDSLNFCEIFKKAEIEGLIPLKKKYFSNIIQNKILPDSQFYIPKYKKFFFRIQKYFNSGNVTYGLNAYQLPFRIEKNNFNFTTPGNYAIGFSVKFQIYHHLSYLLETFFNTNSLSISNNDNTGSNSFKYDLRYVFAKRVFIFSPTIGINKIKISNYPNTLNKYIYNYHIGFTQEFEITHKFNLQLSCLYNTTYKTSGNKLDYISNVPISSTFGINMKL